MAKNKTVKFKGSDVVVAELTVEQLETVLSQAEAQGPPSVIDRAFNGDLVTEQMLLECCAGLSRKELVSVAPSELRPLVDAVKEVNSDFLSGMRTMLG